MDLSRQRFLDPADFIELLREVFNDDVAITIDLDNRGAERDVTIDGVPCRMRVEPRGRSIGGYDGPYVWDAYTVRIIERSGYMFGVRGFAYPTKAFKKNVREAVAKVKAWNDAKPERDQAERERTEARNKAVAMHERLLASAPTVSWATIAVTAFPRDDEGPVTLRLPFLSEEAAVAILAAYREAMNPNA